MKHFAALFSSLLLLIVSCTPSKIRTKPNFQFIEVTSFSDKAERQTVHIDSNGSILKCKYRFVTGDIVNTECYVDTLPSSVMDTLISMVKKLNDITVDSVYDRPCMDNCRGYILRVGTTKGVLKSRISTTNEFHNDVTTISSYISEISIKGEKVDSAYVFVTTTSYLPPKPINLELVATNNAHRKCDAKMVKAVNDHLSNLSYNSVKDFLYSFDNSCNCIADYHEYANETLYKVLTITPTIFLQVIECEKVNQQHLLNEVENPVNDGIDLQKAYNSVKAASARKSTKMQFLNAISLAASKGGQTLSK